MPSNSFFVCMKFSVIHWKNWLIGVWCVFAAFYILHDGYVYLRYATYTAGQNDTINVLISQAENKECQPFEVYNADKRVTLVNVVCLQSQNTSPGSIKK